MPWLIIASLLATLLAGGGAGLIYASDGASPGQALYGLDRAVESVRISLTTDPESRAELALALAEERLAEIEALVERSAPEDLIAQTAADYGQQIQSAAAALAGVAASGDTGRAEALWSLLEQALAVHGRVLEGAHERAAGEAQAAIDSARLAAEAGRIMVQAVVEGGPLEAAPAGMPLEAPAGPPGSLPAQPPSAPTADRPLGDGDAAELLASIEARLTRLGDDAAAQDPEAAAEEVEMLGEEVQALAEVLAASQDTERAAALAALLDSALAYHSQVLEDLVGQVPDPARVSLLQAIQVCETGRLTVRSLFRFGFPGGPPAGWPAGNPGSGAGRP